jgi:hypothetical protein
LRIAETCAVLRVLALRNGEGASAESAIVGNEGRVGVALFMGGETTLSHAVVQSAGWNWQCSEIGMLLATSMHSS